MHKLSFRKWFILGTLIFLWPLMVQGAQSVEPDSVKMVKAPIRIDQWWAPDKGLHLIGSMMVTVGTAKTLEQQFALSRSQSRKWAMGFSFSLGLGKELRDSRQKHNFFSWKDLMADALGIVLGRLILGFH